MAESNAGQGSGQSAAAGSLSVAEQTLVTVVAKPGHVNSNGHVEAGGDTPAIAAAVVGSGTGRPEPIHPRRRGRRTLILAAVIAALASSAWFLTPMVRTAFNTISTDDAYVNGHVTFLAPRVAGQVSRVLVDDNMRVKRGDVLVEL